MMLQVEHIQSFIDGVFKRSSNAPIPNYEPGKGIIYSQVDCGDLSTVDHAVEAAKKAFPKWSRIPIDQRQKLLLRIADLMEEQQELLAQAESRDQGKPLWLARSVDIPRAIANFRYFGSSLQFAESKSYTDQSTVLQYTRQEPIGVCGLISPWNLPLYLLTWKIAPAIAYGNTVVCKPSELTPMTAYLLCHILLKAGLPEGVVQIIHGYGDPVGSGICAHPDVKLISFTGGTQTGKLIRQKADGKKLGLELGGKNPTIICADANLDLALKESLRAAFTNQGEICLCGSRILVDESIYEPFVKRFVDMASHIVVGPPDHKETQMGALISKPHMEKVLGYIDLVHQNKARLACGGKRISLEEPYTQGYYVAPTVITDVTQSCRLVQEEIFGPVVTIQPFGRSPGKTAIEHAISLANDTPYGLSASVFTENLNTAHHLSYELDVGTVWVNCWMKRDLRLPFGGKKASGLGREGGFYSQDFFTELKTVCVQLHS